MGTLLDGIRAQLGVGLRSVLTAAYLGYASLDVGLARLDLHSDYRPRSI